MSTPKAATPAAAASTPAATSTPAASTTSAATPTATTAPSTSAAASTSSAPAVVSTPTSSVSAAAAAAVSAAAAAASASPIEDTKGFTLPSLPMPLLGASSSAMNAMSALNAMTGSGVAGAGGATPNGAAANPYLSSYLSPYVGVGFPGGPTPSMHPGYINSLAGGARPSAAAGQLPTMSDIQMQNMYNSQYMKKNNFKMKKINLACHFCDHAARRPGRQKTAQLVACSSSHCRKVFCSRPSCYKKLPLALRITSWDAFIEWKRQLEMGLVVFICPHCVDESHCPGPQCQKRWEKRMHRGQPTENKDLTSAFLQSGMPLGVAIDPATGMLQMNPASYSQVSQQNLLGLASLSSGTTGALGQAAAGAIGAAGTAGATTTDPSTTLSSLLSSNTGATGATSMTALNAQSKVASANALSAVAAASAAAAAAAKSGSLPLMGQYPTMDPYAIAGGMSLLAPTTLARNQSLGPYVPPTLPPIAYTTNMPATTPPAATTAAAAGGKNGTGADFQKQFLTSSMSNTYVPLTQLATGAAHTTRASVNQAAATAAAAATTTPTAKK